MISLLIWGSFIESVIGFRNIAIIYMLSGIGASYMGSSLNPSYIESVGASGAIFGVVGTLVGIIVVNWKILEKAKSLRCMLICMVVMILLLNLMFSFSSFGSFNPNASKDVDKTTTDNYAHLGGFLSGTF